jgi:Uma2 family endonuclease
MKQPKRAEPRAEVPPLINGDSLDQPTFHERYEAMPEGTRAELIGGVVIMHSPAKKPHSRNHGRIAKWLGRYEDATPGVEMHIDMSSLLGPEAEPQPDCCLLIAPEYGGQTSEKENWTVGVPELVVEVADSSESIDLHGKKADYLKAGVKEYVVVALRQTRVFWFVNRDEALADHPPGPDGIFRSVAFPGLWLEAAALLAGDMIRVLAVTDQGLATSEHAAFLAALAARRQQPSPSPMEVGQKGQVE